MDRGLRRKLDEGSGPEPPQKRPRPTNITVPLPEDTSASSPNSSPNLYHPRPIHPRRSPLLAGLRSAQPQGKEKVTHLVWNWLNYPEDLSRSSTSLPKSTNTPSLSVTRRTASAPANMTEPSEFSPSYRESPLGRAASNSGYGSPRPSTKSSQDMDDDNYRDVTCPRNGVTYEPSVSKPLPSHVQQIVREIEASRESPGPSHDDITSSADLNALENKRFEGDIEAYFKGLETHKILLPADPKGGILQLRCKAPMRKEDVPYNHSMPGRLSTPSPDMLYGYQFTSAFSMEQGCQLEDILTRNGGKTDSLILPFFVVELKGGRGLMSVATSQCLGGSAACVRMCERLNDHLKTMQAKGLATKVDHINSTVFSMSVNGVYAALYATWKVSDGQYKMQQLSSHFLQYPDQYIDMRRKIRNILDWGRGERLQSILRYLEQLAAEPAPLRRPIAPSNGSSVVSSESSN